MGVNGVSSLNASSQLGKLAISLSLFPWTETLIFISCVRPDLEAILGAHIKFQPLLYFMYSGLTFNTLSAPALIPCCVVCLKLLCIV